MRLICPNCGAQYEVPDDVIPQPGRDVQCSNCGDTWFQLHPSVSDHADPDSGADTGGHDWTEADEDDPPEDEAPAPAAPRRDLDPDVASVLREEASRESRARAAEGGGLEMQPELGLSQDDGDNRVHRARARVARLRGITPENTQEEEEDIGPATRRTLLPDVEEINSSLAPSSETETEDPSARDGTRVEAQTRSRPGGFRRGMRIAIGLALIATAAYIFAPRIASTIPTLSDPLAAYVGAVNEGRLALNGRVDDIATQIRTLTGG